MKGYTPADAERFLNENPALAMAVAKLINRRIAARGMTMRQRDLLHYISQYSSENGFCPSYTEMMEALGIASKGGIHRLVVALEKRGFISREAGCARSISIRSAL